jgi:hypothetical protein
LKLTFKKAFIFLILSKETWDVIISSDIAIINNYRILEGKHFANATFTFVRKLVASYATTLLLFFISCVLGSEGFCDMMQWLS